VHFVFAQPSQIVDHKRFELQGYCVFAQSVVFGFVEKQIDQIAIKKSIGRLSLSHNLLETVAIEGIKILPIMPEECIGMAGLPMLHAGSFDRLLVLQAKLYDLVIITRDAKIIEYPVITVRA